ncbi:ankyrin repeat-containing protein ITN1-like [Corylus avellana]|uniref:ankyrin repeat-containing protein ITN1-like n=1 Tax=Corylus avellana TaxID=13451 RepID=UPI00286AAB56|nr:ankyrin repeat-containing protein ITN1-like [Corylus avellana]
MDPSNSFESQSSVNANQPEQTETITFMNRDYYNAAAEGRIEFFKNIINHESLLTPNKNTILHIYITALNSGSNSTTPNAGSESTKTLNAGTESTTLIERLGSTTSLLRQANAKSETPLHIAAGSESTTTLNAGAESTTNFVEEILKKCPSLLWQANAKCETPLHIAARYGHDGIVEVLIEYCAQTRAQTRHDQDLEEEIEPVKELLRMTNKEKDTALHEAVRYNHLEVVKLLISKDPDFSYSANDAGETPLYIAAERGFKDLLFEILDKCKSPMHGGPLGRTALHAALLPRYRYYEYDTGTTYLFSQCCICIVNLVMSNAALIL